MIIHFPIVLFIISVAFDLLAIRRTNPTMAKAVYYNLLAAALTAPVAIASGVTAWQWPLEGARLKGNLLLHLILALAASGMPESAPGVIYIVLALATVLLIAIAGNLGGILSGVETGAT